MDVNALNYVGPGNNIGNPPGEYIANTMMAWTTVDYIAPWWRTANIGGYDITGEAIQAANDAGQSQQAGQSSTTWNYGSWNSGFNLIWSLAGGETVPNQTGITPNQATTPEMFDIFFAPGRSQDYSTEIMNPSVPPYASVQIAACETCGCEPYGAGSAYLRVENQPGDWAGETIEEIGE